MTVPQLVHALYTLRAATHWAWLESVGRFAFESAPAAVQLEPLDSGRHIPKGRAHTTQKKLANGKIDVALSPAPRPRYKLFLRGVPARVGDDYVKLLNEVGDAARKNMINRALDHIASVLIDNFDYVPIDRP